MHPQSLRTWPQGRQAFAIRAHNLVPYMWSDTISSGPTDIGPPNTSHARQTETPDIYEFRFFAFAKS